MDWLIGREHSGKDEQITLYAYQRASLSVKFSHLVLDIVNILDTNFQSHLDGNVCCELHEPTVLGQVNNVP